MNYTLKSIITLIFIVICASISYAGTLQDVKNRGKLICGVSEGIIGFSNEGKNGKWTGLDVDFCRALAAAIFNDPEKIEYVPVTSLERFEVIGNGSIDVLARNTTWTYSRDVRLGINFAGVLYYDGQGFMVRKALGINHVNELVDATICVLSGTTTKLNIIDYFSSNNINYSLNEFEQISEAISAYSNDECDAYTSDLSAISSSMVLLSDPEQHKVLPEVISKEPLGPSVREGDDQWFNLVKWTLFAMINAEELDINSHNIEQMMQSSNPTIKRLLGIDGNFGENLGVNKDWGYRIIKHVGNYGEIFERNLGKNAMVTIPRGINRLWNKGGIMYAPPVR